MNIQNRTNHRFFIKTLGCKVNQYESQAMRELLVGADFSVTLFFEVFKNLFMGAFYAAYDWGEEREGFSFFRHHEAGDVFCALWVNAAAAFWAVMNSYACIEQSEVIVDFGDCANG